MYHRLTPQIAGISLFMAFVGLVSADDGPLMRIVSDDARILVKRGEKVIFAYNKVPTEEAENHEPIYTRSGYIHPLYSPAGKVVTGDYSPDHKHQHGLFFAWTKTKVGKQKAEFWNQKLEKGTVAYHRNLKSIGGRERCELVVEHLWDARSKDGTLTPAIKETWKITARDAGEDLFLFDIEAVQRQQTETPITIEKYHYGGMAIRGSSQWLLAEDEGRSDVILRTDEGLDRIEGNHSRPRWVTMAGPVDGDVAGVTVMCHPDNFRAPQWVRLHPKMPYFVWAPMVEEPFQIKGGKPYVSRYRYVVTDGEVSEERLEKLWKEFAKKE